MRVASSGVLAVLMLLGIGVLGPAAEELFFRGYLQTRLVARHGPFWGILITSLFFAIMHFDPLHSTFALGFGIYCGIIAYRAGSIWASFLAHAANNTLSVVETWYLVEPESIGAWVLITAVAGFFAVALILPVSLPAVLPSCADFCVLSSPSSTIWKASPAFSPKVRRRVMVSLEGLVWEP